MDQDMEITAEYVLRSVRTRMSPAIPLDAAFIQNPPPTRIVETFRRRFDKAYDAGVWKRLSNIVLEPANPFDVKARRHLRQEALILSTFIFTALGLALYFNLRANAG
ncbi:MAG: hypothetical protein U0Q18_32535 [Bryobacteraceae bacterium]